MIENPNHPLLYGKGLYRCHLESQAANKTAASDSNNILWMSWGMHQQFDGLNLTNKQHLVPSIAIEFVSSSNITASSMQFKLKWMVDEAKGASSNKSVLLIIKHTPNDADVVVQLALLRCWITAFIEEAKYLHGGNSVKFVTMGFSAEEIAANKHFAGGQHLEWNAAPACKGHEFKYCLYPKEYSRFKGQSPPQYFMHNEILK